MQPESSPEIAKNRLVDIYRKQYRCLTFSKNLQQKRSFIASATYTFLEELIHLHSEQIKNLIKKCTSDVMNTAKQLSYQQVFENSVSSFEEVTCEMGKKAVFYNLQKMIKYTLFKEFKARDEKDVHMVNLQIQCSLNYTCPRCLRDGQKQNPTSLKVIQLETESTLRPDVKQPKTQTQIVNPVVDTPKIQGKSKLDNIFDGLRRERRKESQAKNNRYLKLRKWWESTGDLLQLGQNPFWSLNVQSTVEVKKKQLFDGLLFRNITNQSMIETYRQKNEKKNRKKQGRSLSIKPSRNEEPYSSTSRAEGFKIQSMKEIQPSRLKSAGRRRTVIDAKAKMAAPVFGETKINMFELQLDTKKMTKQSFLPKRKTYNFEPQLLDRLRQCRIKSSVRMK